jgi:Bacterial RNA polymerase, alpha chain C terminal domain/Sigma-70, region 4
MCSVASHKTSNKINYQKEIDKLLKKKQIIMHYREIDDFFLKKYKTVENAIKYINIFGECVYVMREFYAHNDLVTKDFHRKLKIEIKQFNDHIRKELEKRNEVTVDEVTAILSKRQTQKLFSIEGIKYFISNVSNLDDDLKKSYLPTLKKFVLKDMPNINDQNETSEKTEYTNLRSGGEKSYSPLDLNISDFTLPVRAQRCLEKANVVTVKDLVQYSESDLLSLNNFGMTSLSRIKEVLDSIGLRLGMTVADIINFEAHGGASPTELLIPDKQNNNIKILYQALPWMVAVVARFIAQIIVDEKATVAAALSVRGTKGSEARISDALSDIGFRYFGSIYDDIYEKLSEHHKLIAKIRTHTYPSLSLNEIGTNFGLTRERVRQIEIKIRERFADRLNQVDVTIQSRVVRAMLGKVLPLSTAQSLTERLINPSLHPMLAFFALLEFAGPYKIINNWIVRADALDRVKSLKSILRNKADRIGRIDSLIINRETEGFFRKEEDRNRFLLDYLNLKKIFDEWVMGESLKKRIFLSLYKIGRPATKEEIANYAGLEDSSIVGRYLCGNDFICRSDKVRWAFIDWVDDPYEGIAIEIEQRIKEDGGKTTLDRILTELPTKFGVAESSVRAYLTTPQFIVKSGCVRCATQNELNSTYFGSVDDVPNAVKLDDGSWGARIKVEERFLSGYSARIPAPIACECGLKPGDSLLVPVDGTEHIVSLIWRVNNLLQAIDLGRIAPVLQEYGLKQGDEIVVAPSINDVRIFRVEEAPTWKSLDEKYTETSEQIDSLMKDLFNR